MKRQRVYVQVLNNLRGRWTNYYSKPTVDEAYALLKELQEKYPNATFRVLDKNLISHTY